jgi:hypothetical protein
LIIIVLNKYVNGRNEESLKKLNCTALVVILPASGLQDCGASLWD